jgi:DNA-binding response OmpR family regulator
MEGFTKKSEDKKTLLIVEDDENVLSMMKEYFEYLGYNVIIASNGMDGLKIIKSENYDLLITDIVMPYISGIGLISFLKEKYPDIPVIAVTGYGKNLEKVAAEKRADVVLRKPFTMQILINHVHKLLND